jgi:predicted alpha/beta hydrolase family esterase
MSYQPPRLLIIPGLHDSGRAHWQSWLQAQYRDARRVQQRDYDTPDLPRWAERIQRTLEQAGPGEWLAVAHSFGCLALVRHLLEQPDSPIRQAALIASQNDPWMSAANAQRWATRWGSSFSNLGPVGHINAESGFGPFPLAKRWVEAARARAARERRQQQHAAFSEWSFAH